MTHVTTIEPEATPFASGEQRRFVLPIVRPISRGTAHPRPEMWGAPADSTRSSAPADAAARGVRARVSIAPPRPREVEFLALQRRLPAVHEATRDGRAERAVVVLPSRTVDKWHEPAAVTQAYEERLLCSLLELRDPGLRLTYVTSSRIPSAAVDYQLSLLPRRVRASARSRLTLVALDDASARPLSQKLLDRSRVLERIKGMVRHERFAYVAPFQSGDTERDVAISLGLPLYGAHPCHEPLGSKSGSRKLFADCGVPHPVGVENLSSVDSVVSAIVSLRASRADLSELVLKLDRGVSGEGNAIVDVSGLPSSGDPAEAPAIRQRLAVLAPEAPGVSVQAFLAKLAAGGGIIEERITGSELRSPSVQIQISPTGEAVVVSTHDQILGGASGQSYLGCRFPAEASYAPMISDLARSVGERLAALGVIGRLALDFVVARDPASAWRPYAIEINLRKGGTTHPFETLASLTGGTYDPATAIFTTPTGAHKHYVATDHLESSDLTALGHAGVLSVAQRPELRFNPLRRSGTAFHMVSSINQAGRTGFTAIGDSAEEADALYSRACRTVLEAAATAVSRLRPTAVALAA
jgi:hypothetical protein